MRLLLFLVIVPLVSAGDGDTARYLSALRSPSQLRSMLRDLLPANTSPSELPLRLRLLQSELLEITAHREGGWSGGLNKFSVMTPSEKTRYLGVNMTELAREGQRRPQRLSAGDGSTIPEEADWRHLSTGVKDQDACGSCWAFSAVAPIETTYAQATGKLKQFAEKEMVDCSFGEDRDSCRGAWITYAWDYSIKEGRLATTLAAPYSPVDGACEYGDVHNGYQAAVLSDYYTVGAGVGNLVRGLAGGVVAVGFRVSGNFFRYNSGIYTDSTCYSDFQAYHAVAAVGYTPRAVIFRNSWGGEWGEEGYFRWDRTHHGCEIYNYGHMVELKLTGKEDTDPEWKGEEGGEEDDECGECPCGTVKCADGVCRHSHMC